MAGVLSRFEKRLESAVTGAFARAFRSAVQPVEIAAALQREIDSSAHVLSRSRMLVPNDFTVELSAVDFERLDNLGPTLNRELATLVQEHVDEQRYTLAGPLKIELDEAPELSTGRFRVRSRTSANVTPAAGQRMTETTISRSSVILEVNGMRHPLEPPGLTVGRGSAADLRIDDPGISRKHAEFRIHHDGERTTVTVHDLGSTNGVVLNGHKVSTGTVGNGAHILMGNTTFLIRIVSKEAE